MSQYFSVLACVLCDRAAGRGGVSATRLFALFDLRFLLSTPKLQRSWGCGFGFGRLIYWEQPSSDLGRAVHRDGSMVSTLLPEIVTSLG